MSNRTQTGSSAFGTGYTYIYSFETGFDVNGNFSNVHWVAGMHLNSSFHEGTNAYRINYANVYGANGSSGGGQVLSNAVGSPQSAGGDHDMWSGDVTIYHVSDGTGAYAQNLQWCDNGPSWSGYNYGGGTDVFGLSTIPRYGAISAWSSGAITDEDSLTVNWYHYVGTPVLYLRLDDINSSESAKYIYSPGNPYTYSSLQSWAQGLMTNTTATRMFLYYGDDMDSNGSVDHYNSPWIGTISIKNDTGQANPTFTNYTYLDNNSTTSTITGNNQYLIQGYSDLVVTITTGNQATPNKAAVMNHYTYTIGGYSSTAAWSSSSTVTKDITTVSDVTGAQTLSVIAYDSRGNSTTVIKTVNILPYAVPVVNASAVRANGFDDALILTVAGSVSPLTITGTDKNSIHSVATSTANRVEYRVATDGGSYGSWTDLAATQTAATGAVNGNTQPIIAAAGTASSTHSYQIQVQITDKLNTTVQTLNIPSGTPTFRIGTDGNIFYKEVAYQSTNSITSSATPAPVGSASLNFFYITALAAAATFSEPSGTLTNGNRILFRLKDNGTSRALTWPSSFRSGDAVLPTTTAAGKNMYIGVVWNSTDSKWDCALVSGGL